MFGICGRDVAQLVTFLKICFNLQVEGNEELACNSGIPPPGGGIACVVQTITRLLNYSRISRVVVKPMGFKSGY